MSTEIIGWPRRWAARTCCAIAAVYARKSTEESAVARGEVATRQIDHATAYTSRKGWTVPESCIYVDDGISGAEFAKGPVFVRLMTSLKPRPAFLDVCAFTRRM